MTTSDTDTARLAIATAVAAALGAKLVPPKNDEDRCNFGWFELDMPDGNGIFLRFDGWKNVGRIRITGRYTGSVRDALKYDASSPEITVSSEKTAAKIAADITRRFMPEFLPLAEKCRQIVATRADYAAKKLAAMQSICAGTNLRIRDQQIDIPYDSTKAYGEITSVDQSSCYINLRNVPLDIARQIVQLLQS